MPLRTKHASSVELFLRFSITMQSHVFHFSPGIVSRVTKRINLAETFEGFPSVLKSFTALCHHNRSLLKKRSLLIVSCSLVNGPYRSVERPWGTPSWILFLRSFAGSPPGPQDLHCHFAVDLHCICIVLMADNQYHRTNPRGRDDGVVGGHRRTSPKGHL